MGNALGFAGTAILVMIYEVAIYPAILASEAAAKVDPFVLGLLGLPLGIIIFLVGLLAALSLN